MTPVKTPPQHAVPWWTWMIFLLVTAVSGWALPHLPASVATHFSANGQANAYMPKTLAVLAGPVLVLSVIGLWQILWRIDPKRAGYPAFWPTYRFVGGLTAAFIGATQAWVIGHALGWPVSSVRVVPILVGLLLLLLANVLPRVKPNWWIGVRTPWTLSNDAVWAKTHLWAGRLGVAAGLLMMLGGWMAPAQAALALITWVVAGWGSAVIVLSWIFFRTNH